MNVTFSEGGGKMREYIDMFRAFIVKGKNKESGFVVFVKVKRLIKFPVLLQTTEGTGGNERVRIFVVDTVDWGALHVLLFPLAA